MTYILWQTEGRCIWIGMTSKESQKYAELFPSDTGNIAKPLRMSLGALIIQAKFQFADHELVEQITENPYLQYFIGLPGNQEEAPFDVGTLVLFRKRITAEILMEANEYLLAQKRRAKMTIPSIRKRFMRS